jgi:hypothetical protein
MATKNANEAIVMSRKSTFRGSLESRVRRSAFVGEIGRNVSCENVFKLNLICKDILYVLHSRCDLYRL